jgi:hypothetical protein
MSADGFNPLRWNCAESGCFNLHKRPKIEVFAECLPGKIAFSDVDGIVEIGGRCLMLEFKAVPIPIPTGQRLMFQALSRSGLFEVLCLAGNALTMEVTHLARFSGGEWHAWKPGTIEDAKAAIRGWAKREQYDPDADFGGSIEECYRAVRERKARGGSGWEPPK